MKELSYMPNVLKEREDENMESKRKENQKWSLIYFDWRKNRRVPLCPSSHWGPFDYCAVNCPRLDAPPEIGPEICGSRRGGAGAEREGGREWDLDSGESPDDGRRDGGRRTSRRRAPSSFLCGAAAVTPRSRLHGKGGLGMDGRSGSDEDGGARQHYTKVIS